MTDAPYDADMTAPTHSAAGDFPRDETPIVPRNSIAGRALVAVVAIMTFLASLTTGAVMLILASAAEWQSDVAREMTIQVRPAPGRDLDAEVAKAVEMRPAAPGITDVRPYPAAESARLLEPWLGTGLTLDALPVPRIIVLRAGANERPDLDALRSTLPGRAAGASLEDPPARREP